MQKPPLASLLFFLPEDPQVKKTHVSWRGSRITTAASSWENLSLHQPDAEQSICEVLQAQLPGCSRQALPQPACRNRALRPNVHQDGERARADGTSNQRDLGSSSCVLEGSAEGEQVQGPKPQCF